MAVLQRLQNYTVPVQDPTKTIIGLRSAQLQRENQQEVNAQNVMKTAQMTDQTEWNKMYDNVARYQGLPQEQRVGAMQANIAQGESEGRDMTQAKKYLTLDPQQQQDAFTGMTKYGERKGWLQPGAKPAAQKSMVVKRVVVDGEDRFIGFNPVSGEQIKDLGPAGEAGGTTVTIGGEDKAMRSLRAKEIKTSIDSLRKAETEIRALKGMERAVEGITSKLVTGAAQVIGGPATLKIAKVWNVIADKTGWEKVDPSSVSNAELLDAINTKMAVAVREPGSGQTSNFEMELYMDTYAKLGATPEGMRKRVKLWGVEAARKVKIERKRLQMREAGKGYIETENAIDAMLKDDPYQPYIDEVVGNVKDVQSSITQPTPSPREAQQERVYNYNPDTGNFE